MLHFIHKTPALPMPILTDRLIIRPPKLDDLNALNAGILESFEQLHQFMEWAKKPPTLKESEKYLKSCVKNWVYKKHKEPYLPLFIFEKNTQEFIGVSGFHHYDWKKGNIEIGYWIRTSKSSFGFMREAVAAHTDYAFKILKLKKITITCDPDNVRSRNIPEKLGYTLETILLNDRKKPDSGKPGNTIVFVKYNI